MVNYKPRYPITITAGTLTTPLPPESKFKYLYDNVANIQAVDGFLDGETGLIYQVPSGKTLQVVAFFMRVTAVASSITVHQGDTENAQTDLKATISSFASPLEYMLNFPWTFASSKFITYEPSSTRHQFVEIHGYET